MSIVNSFDLGHPVIDLDALPPDLAMNECDRLVPIGFSAGVKITVNLRRLIHLSSGSEVRYCTYIGCARG